MTPPPLTKYPRTRHLEGSRLQPGDEDLESVALSSLAGRTLVIEEKLDGANAALSFDAEGRLWLQSRGHFLVGGEREKHFDLFKQWAARHATVLFERLGSHRVLYGEWLYAKHTIFYDTLPHYFLEFDVLDRAEGAFLSTARRRALLEGTPVSSVPVLFEGPLANRDRLLSLIRPSLYKSARWKEALDHAAASRSLDRMRILEETDPSELSEGLYVKDEAEGRVLGRYKYVRASFLTAVLESSSHWLSRPIVPNQLAPEVSIF